MNAGSVVVGVVLAVGAAVVVVTTSIVVVDVARATEVVVRAEVDGADVDGPGAAFTEEDDPQPAIATSTTATSAAAVR